MRANKKRSRKKILSALAKKILGFAAEILAAVIAGLIIDLITK